MAKLSKQVSLGYDPVTGKRVRRWIHADSQAGLRQEEKKAIAEYARHGSPSSIKYKDFEDLWFATYKSNLEPQTKKVYKSALKAAVPLHHKKMKDITRSELQLTVNTFWDKPDQCYLYVQQIRNMWNVAVGDGICQKNVTLGLKLPKRTRKPRRPLTKEELTAISKAKFDPLERFMVDVLLQFGLRPGEALALSKQSFNRKARTLTIDKALAHDSNQPYIKTTKTGVTRVLPVPDSFWKKIPNTNTLYYFVEEDGQLMRQHNVWKFSSGIVKKINAAMGGNNKLKLTDMTLYNFRHHKASMLYYLPGVSLKKKAEYMGHSESMFIKTYSHMMEEKEDVEALRSAVNL